LSSANWRFASGFSVDNGDTLRLWNIDKNTSPPDQVEILPVEHLEECRRSLRYRSITAGPPLPTDDKDWQPSRGCCPHHPADRFVLLERDRAREHTHRSSPAFAMYKVPEGTYATLRPYKAVDIANNSVRSTMPTLCS
jgi:hypothetical protein